MNCEYVREVYPDVLQGTANAETVAAVREHLAGCAECRAEAQLIDRLLATPTVVPVGLHERVMSGVAAAPRARRWAPRQLAMAATVAAALIGGALLLDNPRSPVSTTVRTNQEGGLGVVTVEAAMVSGTGSLQDLSVEELEQLLGEIES